MRTCPILSCWFLGVSYSQQCITIGAGATSVELRRGTRRIVGAMPSHAFNLEDGGPSSVRQTCRRYRGDCLSTTFAQPSDTSVQWTDSSLGDTSTPTSMLGKGAPVLLFPQPRAMIQNWAAFLAGSEDSTGSTTNSNKGTAFGHYE